MPRVLASSYRIYNKSIHHPYGFIMKYKLVFNVNSYSWTLSVILVFTNLTNITANRFVSVVYILSMRVVLS